MDTVKQKIQIEQELDRFNIQKSVVGTEEYYINQDIIKGVPQDEIIEKAKSGIYKLTAENKKAGRVGQKYGESKKEEEDDPKLRDLETRLIYAKDFAPHKVEYYKQLIQEHKDSKQSESGEKKEELKGIMKFAKERGLNDDEMSIIADYQSLREGDYSSKEAFDEIKQNYDSESLTSNVKSTILRWQNQ
jgi:hypothetical protein